MQLASIRQKTIFTSPIRLCQRLALPPAPTVSSEHCLHLVLNGKGAHSWSVVGHHSAIGIDQELGKVPWDHPGCLLCGIIKLAIVPQVPVGLTGLRAIHIRLGKEGPLCSLALRKLLDVLIGSWLLAAELVTRECKDLESLLAVLPVHLDHLTVVLLSQSSVRRHIDHHSTLLATAQVP